MVGRLRGCGVLEVGRQWRVPRPADRAVMMGSGSSGPRAGFVRRPVLPGPLVFPPRGRVEARAWGMGTVFSDVAHGREGPLRGGGRFPAGSCAFPLVIVFGRRAPMCAEGVCAHRSGTVAAVETSFPHDSGVSASAEPMRMCSNHRPGTRGPQPRDHPRRIATYKTLEVSQMHAGGITFRLEIGPGRPSAVERSAALKARESLTLPRDGSASNRPRRGTGPTSAGEGALRGRLPLAGPAAPLTAPSAPGCVPPPAPR